MSADFDQLLADLKAGDPTALNRLVGLFYDDFKHAAEHMMSRQRPDHTLQPSALVNEVILRLLVNNTFESSLSREHLYAAAMLAMRQVLIDHARARTAQRRGGGKYRKQPLDYVLEHFAQIEQVSFLELNEALERLTIDDPRAALVVSYHIIFGMTLGEVADTLNLSLATVERDWQYGRAVLRQFLKPR